MPTRWDSTSFAAFSLQMLASGDARAEYLSGAAPDLFADQRVDKALIRAAETIGAANLPSAQRDNYIALYAGQAAISAGVNGFLSEWNKVIAPALSGSDDAKREAAQRANAWMNGLRGLGGVGNPLLIALGILVGLTAFALLAYLWNTRKLQIELAQKRNELAQWIAQNHPDLYGQTVAPYAGAVTTAALGSAAILALAGGLALWLFTRRRRP